MLGSVMTKLVLSFLLFGPALVLNALAYFESRKRGPESRLLPFLGVPAGLLWLYLLTHHVGAQSLGNLAEGLVVGGLSVAVSALKVVMLDPRIGHPVRNTWIAAFLLLGLAAALRVFMPAIPE